MWQRLLLCFSAVSNGEKILSVKNTPGSLTCLNGIRVLSMGWVILGHTFSFLVAVAGIAAQFHSLVPKGIAIYTICTSWALYFKVAISELHWKKIHFSNFYIFQ